MEVSNSLKSYAEEKIREKISKYVTKPIEAHVTFTVDRHNHRAHIALVGGDGFNMQVDYVCDDMYGSLDHLMHRLESQLKKHKERLKDHKGRNKGQTLRDLATSEEYDMNESIDAADILKYEAARKKFLKAN